MYNFDFENFNLEKIRINQPTITVGMIGSVSDGKSTTVERLSQKKTQQFSSEIENNNITIKLGYANTKIYKCVECGIYTANGSKILELSNLKCGGCQKDGTLELLHHISFVDAPGHDEYMTTMLNGTAVMDGALLIISGKNPIPQPQTSEHLLAAEIMQLENLIVCLNKIDLLSSEEIDNQIKNASDFIKGTIAENSDILPISAFKNIGLNKVCEQISEKICQKKTLDCDKLLSEAPLMSIIRSFDINKPNKPISHLKGGVAGGTISQGVLHVGQNVVILPGIIFDSHTSKDRKDGEESEEGEIKYKPIEAKVMSLFSEQNELQFAVPGGLIAVGLSIDPAMTKSDKLVGQIIGIEGKMPNVYTHLEIEYKLIKKLLTDDDKIDDLKVKKLKKNEILQLNIKSNQLASKIIDIVIKKEGKKRVYLAQFEIQNSCVCASIGDNLSLCRKINNRWRLIGLGKIVRGIKATLK